MRRFVPAVLLLIVPALNAPAQNAAARPAFEVAEIKPADPSAPALGGKARLLPGGKLEVDGITALQAIVFAFGVQENMVTGGPAWVSKDRFSIVAKAAPDTPPATLRLMLQTLLTDRFKLEIHREDKPTPAYVLTRGKRELKLRQGAGGRQDCRWNTAESGLRKRECHNMTMAELASQMPGWAFIGIDAPVVDQTGLSGSFDFEFEVGAGNARSEGNRLERGGEAPPPAAADADSGPTVYEALEKLGLHLEKRRMPLPVIVIDRVEQPGSN